MTALSEDEERGLSLGAVDYITRPFHPSIIKARIKNHLVLSNKSLLLENLVEERTQKLKEANIILNRQFLEMLYSFNFISEQKDSYTNGHSKRVAYYATKIAEGLNLSQYDIDLVYKAGLMHDIGKIIIPEAILLKPGKHDDNEFKIMQDHVTIGYEILNQISKFEEVAKIVRSHHEKYDGTGYPDGLKENDIPLLSQIISIADSFDAMTTNRIYNKRKYNEEAIKELESLSDIWHEKNLLKKSLETLKKLPNIDKVNQLPDNNVAEHRFAYFFKDSLTNTHNEEYLETFMYQHFDEHKYACVNILSIRNMHKYNKEFGWDAGNELLKSLSSSLKSLKNELVFRFHGDQFILLNKEHYEIDLEEINSFELLNNTGLHIENTHIDLRSLKYDEWKKFIQRL